MHRILQDTPFGPFEIERMVAAYEQAIRALRPPECGDGINERIARKIVEVTKTGIRDPAEICAQAMRQLGLSG